jgi:hypothetical protein
VEEATATVRAVATWPMARLWTTACSGTPPRTT